jgi:hypothetical protein
MALRWWTRALNVVWQLLSCANGCKRVGHYPAWLRRDIGLMDEDVPSVWEHVDEIRRKHHGWL